MSKKSKLQQFEEVLERYYDHFNISYLNDEQNGKMKIFLDENGYDENDFNDEMEATFEDCTVIEFDDDFPLESKENDEDKRKEKIYKITQKIYNGETSVLALLGHVSAIVDYAFFALGWNEKNKKWDQRIDEEWMEKTQKKYNKVLQTVNLAAESHLTIFRILAVGLRNNFPYLQFVSDMYNRERIENTSLRDLKVGQWVQQNNHTKSLKDIKIAELKDELQPFIATKMALEEYAHRMCPRLQFTPSRVIKDSMEETAEYIACAVEFVARTKKEKLKTCPFQFDFIFAFDETVNPSIAIKPDLDDDDDDDIDPTDEKDDIDSNVFFDCFGNIKGRLTKEKCLKHVTKIENVDDIGVTNTFARQFKVFQDEITKAKYIDEYKHNDNDEYPRGKRFCGLIDRRQPQINDKYKTGTIDEDELIFYEPPGNCNKLPSQNDMVNEWFFDSVQTCIIPNIGYDNGIHGVNRVDDSAEEALQDEVIKKSINSRSHCKGAMMILSFHVLSTNITRCYLYHSAMATRFMPRDIIDLLPIFFDPNTFDNQEFPSTEKAKKLVERCEKGGLDDYQFDAFYKSKKGNQQK